MATYLELFALKNDSNLQDRVQVAVIVAAETVRTDDNAPSNQAARLVWAAAAMQDPVGESRRMLWAVLAANKDATTDQILAADDATLQARVDAAVDLFAGS